MATTAALIAAETSARKAADAKLQTQIDILTAQVAKLTPVPPGPQPTPTPTGVLWPPGDTLTQLASLVKDRTVAEIWLDGIYRCPELYFGGDRGGHPLRFGSAPGKTHLFTGPGKTLGGQIFIGDPDHGDPPCTGGPWTFDGIRAGGGIKLAKAGVIELRRGTGIRILAPYATGDIRDATYVTPSGTPKPYHTWLVYGSSKAGGGLHDVVIDDAIGDGIANSWSLIQFDSGEEPMSDIHVRRAVANHCYYLLYGNIDGTGIELANLTGNDTPSGVHWLKGSGTWTAITPPFVNDIPQLMRPA